MKKIDGRNRHPFHVGTAMNFLRIIAASLLFSGCVSQRPPLAPIAGKHVASIEVNGYLRQQESKTCVLVNPEDIQFVTTHLNGLKADYYHHSSPEFNVEFKTTEGTAVRLRVSKNEIGPDAPASAYNVHWFPPDTALYEFLKMRAYGNNSSSSQP